MTREIPPIYFYIPKAKLSIKELPDTPENYWQWIISGKIKDIGQYSWTLLTYIHLKINDFPCELTTTLPGKGILLSHRLLLPNNFQPTPKLLMVCLQADRVRHPYAQLHVVQNPIQEISKGFRKLWGSYFIPHWSQPGLIPRNPTRGDRFENIAFFGGEQNLVHELREPLWHKTLAEMGLHWQIFANSDQWYDYSKVDLVLALRSFGYNWDHTWKPASKLYNAWLAGVPAILGRESAYQAERKSELDYLEVASYNSLISTIRRLKEDGELRRAMAENAKVRSLEIQPTQVVQQWQDFLQNIALPAYESWCQMSEVQQKRYLQTRYFASQFFFAQRYLRFIKTKIESRITGRSIIGQQYRRDL